MKRTIIASLTVFMFILASGFIFDTGNSADKASMLPDHICVYLNGSPVTGAIVTVGSNQYTTASDGCASLNLSSGGYCVFATYNGYQACGPKEFTDGVDEMTLNLSKQQCDCPDW